MPLSRLVAITLLVFPFIAFGQSKQSNVAPGTQQVASATVPAEPWRILPNDSTKTLSPQDSLSQQQIKQSETLVKPNEPDTILQDRAKALANKMLVSPDGQLALDNTCFAIRSYVVARDSKNSDSTHLVHYSTCQPASRYRVKTIELKEQTPKPLE
jgi:hypothetical protein